MGLLGGEPSLIGQPSAAAAVGEGVSDNCDTIGVEVVDPIAVKRKLKDSRNEIKEVKKDIKETSLGLIKFA